MINKIFGKRSTETKHLQVGDKEVTTVSDIADTLVESFSKLSSNKHYSSKFQSHEILNLTLRIRRYITFLSA